jgi:DNA-3-methyladenine glycosylase II
MQIIETDADIREGLAHLRACDRRLVPIIDLVGAIPLRRHQPGFHGLCDIVISQQLSVASADAILARTVRGLGALTPSAVLAADEPALRACGLSGPKLRTLRALAEAVRTGALPIETLHTMPIDQAASALVAVKGIGPWTAEIYLMFYAGHADVFAPGDLALQEAIRLAFGLDQRPSTRDLTLMAQQWSPWRAVAARLLWAYYRIVKAREGVTG